MAKDKHNSITKPSAAKSADTPLRAFDDDALSTLTAKIEDHFRRAKVPENQKLKSKPQAHSSNSLVKRPSNDLSNDKASSKGRKRDARGKLKESDVGAGRFSGPLAEEQDGNGTHNRDILLKEILALGGNEEDLELVADVSSDYEETEKKGRNTADESTFTKELSKFVAGLGITGISSKETRESEPESQSEPESNASSDAAGKPESNTSLAEREQTSQNGNNYGSFKLSTDPNRLVFEARSDWHAANLPQLPVPALSQGIPNEETIIQLRKYAESLLEADSILYASKHLSSTSSHRFLSTIMSSGTLSDKVSALTLVVQESPVHTTKSFESLLSLAKKRSRGQAVTALGALKDLLGAGDVLPTDRRLRSFGAQPGLVGTLQTQGAGIWKPGNPLPGSITQAHLISWSYEHWLKDAYFEMLKVLEGWCSDEIEFARGRAVTYVYELLLQKPEQESNLLRLLVNKLGDPEKKIASRASYLILQLQNVHPLMKSTIIQEIQNVVLLRSGQSSHATYYAINTLNQTILSGKEEDLSRKLLNIYFDLFVTLLKKPELPQVEGAVINKKGQIQGGGGKKGRKAMEKASKEDLARKSNEETTEKMISAVLTGVNRAFPFARTDENTLESNMDMLFRITHSSNFNTSVQALMLIQQLATSKNIALDRFYKTLYESLLDPRLTSSSKHAMYLNLLFRALKSDLNVKRVKAFAKRLLQIITLHQPPFICGALFLLRELELTFPGLRSLTTEPEEHADMESETFRDVIDDTDDVALVEFSQPENHMHPERTLNPAANEAEYDGRKRDPEHSNADKSCLWELLPFAVHFHPSVSMFASRLLSAGEMPPKPDLASHTLIHFLDKFAYRNAKANASSIRGTSIMQPLAGGDSPGVLLSNGILPHGHESINSETFWSKNSVDVAVDEIFFHKYFTQVGKTRKAAKKKVAKDFKSANDPESGDDREDEIWQALVDSRPEVEGDIDDGSGLEMLDLDDFEGESSAGSDGSINDQEMTSDLFVDGELLAPNDVSVDGDWDNEPIVDHLFKRELLATSKEDSTKDESRKRKRKSLKSLPTFASLEDYEEMLGNDDG